MHNWNKKIHLRVDKLACNLLIQMECNVGKLTLSDIWNGGQQGRPLLPPHLPPPLPALLSTSSLLEAEARAQFSYPPLFLPSPSSHAIPLMISPSILFCAPHTAHNNSHKADKTHIIKKNVGKGKCFMVLAKHCATKDFTLSLVHNISVSRALFFLIPHTCTCTFKETKVPFRIQILNSSMKQHANNTKKWLCTVWKRFPPQFPY